MVGRNSGSFLTVIPLVGRRVSVRSLGSTGNGLFGMLILRCEKLRVPPYKAFPKKNTPVAQRVESLHKDRVLLSLE
jgi:hypothetical protein